MLFNTLAYDSPTLDQIVEPILLSISPDRSITDAIALMTQDQPRREKTERLHCRTIVVEGNGSIGILGEQEIINAIATKKNLANLCVAEVMTQPKITVDTDRESDISQILLLLQYHQLDQVLVVNSNQKVQGIITIQSILQHLKPINYLNLIGEEKRLFDPGSHLETIESLQNIEREENPSKEDLKQQLAECKNQFKSTQKRIKQAVNQYQLIQRIDQKLRSSQQEIRSFLAALTDVVLIIHLHEDKIEIKDTPPNQFYSKHPDIIQETIQQLSQPAQAQWVFPPIQQALETQDVVSLEYDLHSEIGVSWFSAKISPLSENTVVWVAQDITARKQAELEFQQLAAELEYRITERTAELQKVNIELRQALQERKLVEQQLRDSEQKFRQLAESIREVFFIWSLDGLELLYVSPAFEEVWGISPEVLYKNPNLWMAMIHPEDRTDIEDIFSAEFQNGNWDHEFRIIRPDEEIRWIWTRSFPVQNESGAVYRIVGLAEDITERRRVREALEESEGQLATLADISPVGIFRTDINGEYLYVNERVSEIVGQPLRDFKAKHWLSMVHPSDRQKIEQAWILAEDDYEPIDLEYRLNRSDGAIIWVFARVIPDYDDWAVVKGFVGTLTDISERKQIETELQQLNQ
ncbi:MAG: PAS domain-containing protein, partial [Cyanobacteriota bacterium]|nr:PAS domain-containing protein [Cyanobacteriota bacterium]